MPMRRSGHVLVAPDKFKGSLTAAEAATRIAAGVVQGAPGTAVRVMPVADGGEGTVLAAAAAGFELVPAQVTGPAGDLVTASIAVRGDVAVVEAAQASGLQLLPGGIPRPLTASSCGVGQLIAAAVYGPQKAPRPGTCASWTWRWPIGRTKWPS
jgi:glycerate 2-kinase